MWRFDWAWPHQRVALEVDGGAFMAGRHTRGAGFRNDIEKRNAAVLAGWRVLHCLPEQLATAATFDMLAQALGTSPEVARVVDLRTDPVLVHAREPGGRVHDRRTVEYAARPAAPLVIP